MSTNVENYSQKDGVLLWEQNLMAKSFSFISDFGNPLHIFCIEFNAIENKISAVCMTKNKLNIETVVKI